MYPSKFFKTALTLLAVAAGAGFAGCSSEADDVRKTEADIREKLECRSIDLSSEQIKTAADLKNFYLNFTKDMAKYVNNNTRLQTKNMVISPLSAAMVLGVMANGVEADNAADYLRYLGTTDLAELNNLCHKLLVELPEKDNMVDMNMINSIWVNEFHGLSLNKSYSDLFAGTFLGESFCRDFNKKNKETISEINRWCENNTQGEIKNFLKSLDLNAYAVVLNALYFDAPWDQRAFEYGNIETKRGTFRGLSGHSEVEMMVSKPYLSQSYHHDDYDLYNIMMGNEGYTMILLLPNENLSLAEVMENLTPESFYESVEYSFSGIPWNESMTEEDIDKLRRKMVTFTLPKLTIKNEFDLGEMLGEAGHPSMTTGIDLTMFDAHLNGKGIEIKQSASFSIAERGVKASAVSGITMEDTATGGVPENPVFDRPFLFFIQEPTTQAIIMAGQVTDL